MRISAYQCIECRNFIMCGMQTAMLRHAASVYGMCACVFPSCFFVGRWFETKAYAKILNWSQRMTELILFNPFAGGATASGRAEWGLPRHSLGANSRRELRQRAYLRQCLQLQAIWSRKVGRVGCSRLSMPSPLSNLKCCAFKFSEQNQSWTVRVFSCQDISAAGSQEGLDGSRSSLIANCFDIFDQLDAPLGPEACWTTIDSSVSVVDFHINRSRKALYLENVKALLGSNKKCRRLLAYILQAGNMFVVGAGYDVKCFGESFSAGMRKKGAASPLVLQFCVQRWFACGALRSLVVWKALQPQVFGLPCFQMHRRRIFLVAAVAGVQPFQELSLVSDVMTKHGTAVAVDLQDTFSMDHWTGRAWNQSNAVPLHQWLAPVQSKSDSSRLQCLGNVVIPQQAALAVSCLAQVMADKLRTDWTSFWL